MRKGGTGPAGGPLPPSRERFLSNDRYRAEREWRRYEGTAQRDLFRLLRERFLTRHSPRVTRAIDVGSGPGRFTSRLGANSSVRRVALDLSREMLRLLPEVRTGEGSGQDLPDRVLGDALRSPFRDGAFGLVAALGNLLGFAGDASDGLLAELERLLAPGGTLLVEIAPGPGERSRYLRRLPPSAVARLLRTPAPVVASRVSREGFLDEPWRRSGPGEFRRIEASSLRDRLAGQGFRVRETLAVAPALGPDALRCAAVARDPKAWGHLLEVEEALGRLPERWPGAAAVLVAAVGPNARGERPPPFRPESEG